MYEILEDSYKFEGDKLIITTIAKGDILFAKEVTYIKYQRMIDDICLQ